MELPPLTANEYLEKLNPFLYTGIGVWLVTLLTIFFSTLVLLVGQKKGWWKLPKIITMLLTLSLLNQLYWDIVFVFDLLRIHITLIGWDLGVPLNFFSLFLAYGIVPLCFIFHIGWRSDIHLRLRYAIMAAHFMLLTIFAMITIGFLTSQYWILYIKEIQK